MDYSKNVEEIERKYRKRRKRKKLIPVLIILVLVILLISTYFQRNLNEVLLNGSTSAMQKNVEKSFNSAVYYTLGTEYAYDELIKTEKDSNGNVSSLSANSLKINKIARDVSSLTQAMLNKETPTVPVPVGAVTGIDSLSSFGPKIKIKVNTVSAVNCSFSSVFESVGINQTKHSIYLTATSEITLLFPSSTQKITVEDTLLISETVIVGKIPEVYFNTPFL